MPRAADGRSPSRRNENKSFRFVRQKKNHEHARVSHWTISNCDSRARIVLSWRDLDDSPRRGLFEIAFRLPSIRSTRVELIPVADVNAAAVESVSGYSHTRRRFRPRYGHGNAL